MTMTTGELDYDTIFRLDPSGGSDDAEEIRFPPISFILWIMFIILMPIILTNMLVCSFVLLVLNGTLHYQINVSVCHKYKCSSNVFFTLCSMETVFFFLFSQTSLAVGDTEEVQKEAQLQKLALQVSQMEST